MKKKTNKEIESYEAKVIEEIVLNCDACGLSVYQCKDCTNYFEKNDSIYCMIDESHLCESCFEYFMEQKDDEIRRKHEDEDFLDYGQNTQTNPL